LLELVSYANARYSIFACKLNWSGAPRWSIRKPRLRGSSRADRTLDQLLRGTWHPDPNDARHEALVAPGNAIKRQALVIGFSDVFAVIAFVLVLAAIAIMLTESRRLPMAALRTDPLFQEDTTSPKHYSENICR